MREIKVRAWIGTQMEYRVVAGELGNFWAVIDPKDSASAITTKYGDQTPIMQFTGLLDKGGKEIYEGDIVRPLGDTVSWTVYFKDGSFLVGPLEEQTLLWSYLCEVIGNIYENPELIKEIEGKK